MGRLIAACAVLVAAIASVPVDADSVTRETFEHGGRTRTMYAFVPDGMNADAPAPLLIVLHGSGRDGASIVNPWREIARKERIIVIGPDSADRAAWNLSREGPDFFQALVNAVRAKYPVDPRRMYLFGHSAGAIQALMMGLLESEYFAAVAVHAGALTSDNWDLIAHADRKIPTGIWVGTADALFPVTLVTATQEALQSKGIPVHLRILKNHDHNYYRRADAINPEAWAFLKSHKLDREPKFKQYAMQ